MTVFFLVYDLIRGGTEGQCARAALALQKESVDVKVGVFRKRGYFLEKIEAACGPVYHFDIQRMISLDTRAKIKALKQWLQDEEISIVHAWDMDAVIFGYPAVRGLNIPFISSRRNTAGVLPPHKKCLLRHIDRKAQRVVVNARCIKDMVVEHGVLPSRVVVIPNFIDIEEFPPSEKVADEKLTLGIVSRLDPEKDVAMAIRAMTKLPEIKLLIAGDGEERADLEALAKELKVNDAVTFLGDTSDVTSVLKQIDIGLLVPKSNEGLSNALLEYMASALPVIATDQGGNRELLLDSGAGELVRIGDSHGLAATVLRWAENLKALKERGRKGREYILRCHSHENIVSELKKLYREAL